MLKLSTYPIPDGENNVFIGWYVEALVSGFWDYVLLSNEQTFIYEIEGEVYGGIYAVWTTGENPFAKKYVDIRVENGFIMFNNGEVGTVFDNAYSVISVSRMGMGTLYDDPTDEVCYELWDITYRYEIDGELNHEIRDAYIDEYGYYPANFWIDDPQYSYPDGVINVTGIEDINDDAVDGEINVE